ncbi:MAG: hypothetical protein R6U88_00870 [Candidatus Bipolaricaulota bacterium]
MDSWNAMWNTGMGAIVYVAVRLALRHPVNQIEHHVDEALGGRPHRARPPEAE